MQFGERNTPEDDIVSDECHKEYSDITINDKEHE